MKSSCITNDQGAQMMDTGYILHAGVPVKEVSNGCFCCNFQQLEGALADLYEADWSDIIFAESVGSCTEFIVTVADSFIHFIQGVKLAFQFLPTPHCCTA